MSGANRDQARLDFLQRHGLAEASLRPLAQDASFRRYYRLAGAGRPLLLMDAPPPTENVAAFTRVTRHLAALEIRVPAIVAENPQQGFLLLEDLGDDTFTRLLAAGGDETRLYREAVDLLVRLQRQPAAGEIELPAYDLEAALAEVMLLVDWYLPAIRRARTSAETRQGFASAWTAILENVTPLPATLVLRDYHVDNLMLVDGDCAVLDYQDALIGSPAYDLVSLLEDARRDIDPDLSAQIYRRYLEGRPDLDRDALRQHCIVWGAQRHAKVAGIFVRLWLRDGKDVYLDHLPRVLRLLRRNLSAPELEPLRNWLLEHLPEEEHRPFHSPASELAGFCKTS